MMAYRIIQADSWEELMVKVQEFTTEEGNILKWIPAGGPAIGWGDPDWKGSPSVRPFWIQALYRP
jgi:hypothetical protein